MTLKEMIERILDREPELDLFSRLKVTPRVYRAIKRDCMFIGRGYESQSEIGLIFGVGQTTVSAIKRSKNFAHYRILANPMTRPRKSLS